LRPKAYTSSSSPAAADVTAEEPAGPVELPLESRSNTEFADTTN